MLFLTFLQLGPFPNRIFAVLTSPVNIRPMDIGLLLLLTFSLHKKFSKQSFAPVAFI
jgi:hypothetical protein